MTAVMQVRQRPTLDQVWHWLEQIPDPEIPVISIVELGVVREVAWSDGGACVVTVTPTYSGCPAIDLINAQIRECLRGHGIRDVRLRTRLAPAWSSDWLTTRARQQLRDYGIAPPPARAGGGPGEADLHACHAGALDPQRSVPCPHCGSTRTELISAFGSTPCKSLHRCLDCLEPFDHFKCH